MEILGWLADYFQLARPWLGGGLCLLGAVLAFIGTVGVMRFPDFYTRLHAASVTDTSAVTAMVLGMALLPETSVLNMAKLGAIWVFMFIAGPTAAHAVGNAAYTAGLQPRMGQGGLSEDGGDAQ